MAITPDSLTPEVVYFVKVAGIAGFCRYLGDDRWTALHPNESITNSTEYNIKPTLVRVNNFWHILIRSETKKYKILNASTSINSEACFRTL